MLLVQTSSEVDWGSLICAATPIFFEFGIRVYETIPDCRDSWPIWERTVFVCVSVGHNLLRVHYSAPYSHRSNLPCHRRAMDSPADARPQPLGEDRLGSAAARRSSRRCHPVYRR